MKRLDQAMGNAPDAVLEEVGGAFAQCDDATTQSIQNAIHLHNAVNSYLRAQGVVELDPPSWT